MRKIYTVVYLKRKYIVNRVAIKRLSQKKEESLVSMLKRGGIKESKVLYMFKGHAGLRGPWGRWVEREMEG